MTGTIIAVTCDAVHQFSKSSKLKIRLIEGYGVEGDAHAGRFIRHRYQAKQTPNLPNNRQVHLIQSELFDEFKVAGFQVGPGDLGENISTRGIELLKLPLGSLLYMGRTAVVELTGLRTPCGYIDKFRKGLKRAMIVKTERGVTFRAGVLGVVRASGVIAVNDSITVKRPEHSCPLPAL
jgi:MOSC domain-containing protein YiiM